MLQLIKKTHPAVGLFVFIFSALAFFTTFNNPPAHAVTAADWRAGYIIDDAIFYDNNSMSTQDIQIFLNSKLAVCDTAGTMPSEYGGGTRAQYGTSKGYPPPYVWL